MAYVPFIVKPRRLSDRRRVGDRHLFSGDDLSVPPGRQARSGRRHCGLNRTADRSSASRGLNKFYETGSSRLHVLRDVDLEVTRGEMVAIVGASGVGKSTLLHLLGGLDRADSGSIRVGDTDLLSLADTALVAFRNRHVGFVFQFHHLLPEFDAVENVEMPMRIARMPLDEARRRSTELLTRVSLGERASHRPNMLSGGEQQRVAVARALVMRPALAAGRRAYGRSRRDHRRRSARPAARDARRARPDVGHRDAQPASGRRVRSGAKAGAGSIAPGLMAGPPSGTGRRVRLGGTGLGGTRPTGTCRPGSATHRMSSSRTRLPLAVRSNHHDISSEDLVYGPKLRAEEGIVLRRRDDPCSRRVFDDVSRDSAQILFRAHDAVVIAFLPQRFVGATAIELSGVCFRRFEKRCRSESSDLPRTSRWV